MIGISRQLRPRASILMVVCAIAISASAAQAQDSTLIDFEIEDQFKVKHRDEDYADRVLVVIGSDKGGSQYNEEWGKAIRDSLPLPEPREDLAFLAVADVRGVPFFLKGMIRGKFPKEKEKWALVDWNGRFAKAYGWEKEVSNVMVFDGEGRLVVYVSGPEVEHVGLARILTALRALLPAAPVDPDAPTTPDHRDEALPVLIPEADGG